MDKFAKLTGRQYHLFDYFGHPEAERVIILMGSGGETAEETVNYLAAKGEKVGAIRVRLYRPFSIEALPQGAPEERQIHRSLDRTKEPGSAGEPLYMDVVNALTEGRQDEHQCLRRTLRLVLQGIHTGDGQGGAG